MTYPSTGYKDKDFIIYENYKYIDWFMENVYFDPMDDVRALNRKITMILNYKIGISDRYHDAHRIGEYFDEKSRERLTEEYERIKIRILYDLAQTEEHIVQIYVKKQLPYERKHLRPERAFLTDSNK